MKNLFVKVVSMMLCLLAICSVSACKDNGTSSDVSTGEDAIVVGIDDASNVAAGKDSSSSAASNTTSVIGGNTKDYGGSEITQKVVMDSSDPFANIPKRLVGTTVRFATWGDESSEVYMKVIKAFEKKTGINVEIVRYSQDTYTQSIATQIVNKAAPDVVIAGFFPQSFQILQPVQNIIDFNDDFWDKEIAEYSKINGNTYFINSWTSVWESSGMVYYNKKIFENNGITSPGDYYAAGKWTYENYFKCAEDVTKLGYKGMNFNAEFYNVQVGNPPLSYSVKDQKFTNNLSKSIEGYKIKQMLIKRGLDTLDTGNALINGTMAMCTGSLFGAKYNGDYMSMEDSALALVPLPESYRGKKLNCAVSVGARAYGIAKGAKNPEGSAYFLRYFLDYANYEKIGANAFKNNDLKKTYFNEVVPLYKNNKNRLIYFNSPLMLIGKTTNSDEIGGLLKDVSESQVDTVVATKNNIYTSAAEKANDIIAKIS